MLFYSAIRNSEHILIEINVTEAVLYFLRHQISWVLDVLTYTAH